MEAYLNLSISDLKLKKGFWTAKEIEQQPVAWRQTQTILDQHQSEISDFLVPILAKSGLRIVLSGAGTSAFAGKALAPFLAKSLPHRIEAVATTDIVSNPDLVFAENCPTLLVSFARSGNSPESVAAFDLANQMLNECYHLVLTCNNEGLLYHRAKNEGCALAILMPNETHDQAFAMTSSLTSMMWAALCALNHKTDNSKASEGICKVSEVLIKEIPLQADMMCFSDIERVIYLGSAGFHGIAQESALKLLELTAGNIVALYDTPLGFRHGPKSIVNSKTCIVVFISNDPYARKYDLDLLTELRKDKVANKVIAITAQKNEVIEQGEYIYVSDMGSAPDVELLFPYVLFPQIYAFYFSLYLNITPDNPCPTGEVNRVVQGVSIHPFHC